ncbi:Sulfotransferase family protein [Candidatus Electrothrix aarhusensis]
MTPSIATNKKILFVHIPKCAGVSMAETLAAQTELIRIGPHAKCRDIFEPRGKLVREDYFAFSFIRNPWDRLVSTFFYILKGGRAEIDKQRRDEYLLKYQVDFKRFVLDIESWFSLQEKNSIYPDKFIPHFRPQHEFICDEDGKIVVDFIGCVENMVPDFERLCSHLALQKSRMSKTNKSSHRAYHKYYDEETVNIVAEYYAKDIELFGYQFEPEKSRLGRLFAGMGTGEWKKKL